jgi:acyl-coenzyme A synthetase/AMP-(fatty) acid ligase
MRRCWRSGPLVADLPKTSTGKVMRRELRTLDAQAMATTLR